MDLTPLVLIMTPILLPVVKSFGMDPVQFGVVMMLNLGIGLCTPPVGTALFTGLRDCGAQDRERFQSDAAAVCSDAGCAAAGHLYSGADDGAAESADEVNGGRL